MSEPAGGRSAASLYDVDPDTVALLVLACPAVAGLSGGPFGAAVTYLPGRSVAGVRLDPDTVEVHVVARSGPTVAELAGQVRRALAGQVLGRSVDIVVEDVADPVPALPVPGASPQSAVTEPAGVVTGVGLGGSPAVTADVGWPSAGRAPHPGAPVPPPVGSPTTREATLPPTSPVGPERPTVRRWRTDPI